MNVVETNSTTPNRNKLAHALLRFERVVILTTCFIRNALAIRPLTAGIAAIERIRPFGREHIPALFADLSTGRLGQTPLS